MYLNSVVIVTYFVANYPPEGSSRRQEQTPQRPALIFEDLPICLQLSHKESNSEDAAWCCFLCVECTVEDVIKCSTC